MKHLPSHDELMDYPRCPTCRQRLSAAYARMAESVPGLGPHEPEMLIRRLREELGNIPFAQGAAG